ncbi:Crp/Fnr family transcriptional regulator [Desulfovibrio sp. OttesenSCG-928-F07]|nr:Crp/Fnr family transcriptional regulator [Desulfovibrio sp. OttesenSCG-928-F07]
MKNKSELLANCALFTGAKPEEIESMLTCLGASEAFYKKGQFIKLVGDTINGVGIILSGKAHIAREDFWGNRSIVSALGPLHFFAEAFCFAPLAKYPVSVLATEDCNIMFIDHKKLITPCSTPCPQHLRLIKNMLGIIAKKNVLLTEKIDHVSRHRTREKLMAYLSFMAKQNKSSHFTIPFNRQELADYLSIDRSAMSNELSKMHSEGLIKFKKNEFELL